MRPFLLASAALAAALSGCGSAAKKAAVENLTHRRVTDVVVTRKITGARELLLFSMAKETDFVEGFIRGRVVDWEGNPIEGVRVEARAVTERGEAASRGRRTARSTRRGSRGEEPGLETSYFTAGLSDANGAYAVRFSLPILDKEVDVRGELLYNPGWESRKEKLGGGYRPHVPKTEFRLYYHEKDGYLAFGEGPQTLVVNPETTGSATLPGARVPLPEPQTTAPQPADGGEDDFFGGGF